VTDEGFFLSHMTFTIIHLSTKIENNGATGLISQEFGFRTARVIKSEQNIAKVRILDNGFALDSSHNLCEPLKVNRHNRLLLLKTKKMMNAFRNTLQRSATQAGRRFASASALPKPPVPVRSRNAARPLSRRHVYLAYTPWRLGQPLNSQAVLTPL